MGLSGGLAANGGVPVTGGGSPVTWNIAAGSPILSNKLVSSDANPAFQITGDGHLQWGAGGASAPDTILFRSAGTRLLLNSAGSGTSGVALGFNPSAGAYEIVIDGTALTRGVVGGVIVGGGPAGTAVSVGPVGPASASGITFQNGEAGSNLYRSAAGTIKTDGVLIGDPQTSQASATTAARTGGTATALPAAPVKYLALRDETGARVYVPAYS